MPLNKKHFDDYIREHKPYLNPHFKIADLQKPFGTNRSYLSRFINRTYRVNFSSFVNRCRLKEIEYLKALPENQKTDEIKLAVMAGFGSRRNYLRTKQSGKRIKK